MRGFHLRLPLVVVSLTLFPLGGYSSILLTLYYYSIHNVTIELNCKAEFSFLFELLSGPPPRCGTNIDIKIRIHLKFAKLTPFKTQMSGENRF